MARRTRQSTRGSQRNQALLEGATGENTSTQANAIGGQGVDNQTQPQGVLNGNGKRTFPHDNPDIPATSEVQPSPPKRARDGDKGKGPADSHPMQLKLTNEDAQAEPEREPERAPEGEGSGGGKGKQPALRRTTSFYPGYYGLSSISQLTTDTLDTPVDPSADDPQSENEDDWIDDSAVDHTQGPRAGPSGATANERPTWQGSGTTSASVAIAPTTVLPGSTSPPPTSVPRISVSCTSAPRTSTSAIVPPSVRQAQDSITAVSESTWPSNTDLSFAPGSTRLMLTAQRPLIRAVIQEAIENVRAAMLFNDAFPNLNRAFTFIRDALISAAYSYGPVASMLYKRLMEDDEYLARIIPLPRARISLFRAEVRERCNAITLPTFLAMASREEIIESVRHQLSNYNYTFPTVGLPRATRRLERRTRPYRNDRIITVIRELYFTGGNTSFAARFPHFFAYTESGDRENRREVPIPMVALVATALYATLYEWRTGEQQVTEFSASAYLDVYNGHINTLHQIKERRSGAFRAMMSEIYTQASAAVDVGVGSSVPIAALDFEDLED
ncbi:hypothetical protein H4582DRAFT_2074300 [Lactarius indigo]|nr:hypothetical protein H4582DRAFT_2074300 [Lactarius indigo]